MQQQVSALFHVYERHLLFIGTILQNNKNLNHVFIGDPLFLRQKNWQKGYL